MLPRVLIACLMASSAVAASDHATSDELSVRLVSAQATLGRGGQGTLGLIIEHQPHWHSYWKNPGDAGLATRLRWSLPAGARAGEIEWPAPIAIDLAGIVSYGYEGRVLLPLAIEVAADYAGDTLPLRVRVDWLACREECIPGRADLALDLPVADVAVDDPRQAGDLAAARERLPQAADWPARVHLSGSGARIEIEAPATLPLPLHVFPADGRVLAHAVALAPARREGAKIVIDARPSEQLAPTESLELTLVADGRAWRLPARVLAQ